MPPEIERLHTVNAVLQRARHAPVLSDLPLDDLPSGLRLVVDAAIANWPADALRRPELLTRLWTELLEEELNKAARLALPAALELGEAGPSVEDLVEAPSLAEWTPVMLASVGGVCIVGTNHGHPLIRGRAISTSLLCGLDVRRTWARTLSRWYRLGRFVTLEELTELHGFGITRLGAVAVTVEYARDWLEADRIGLA